MTNQEKLLDALSALEKANEAVCAGRTQKTYLAMLDDGQQDDLLALDEARRQARSLIQEMIH